MAETDSRILEYLEEGLFLYGVGKVQESIVRWRKVLELDPRNERAMDYIESAGGDVSSFRQKAGLPAKGGAPATSVNPPPAPVVAPAAPAPAPAVKPPPPSSAPPRPATLPMPNVTAPSAPLDVNAFLQATGTAPPARPAPADTGGPMPWQQPQSAPPAMTSLTNDITMPSIASLADLPPPMAPAVAPQPPPVFSPPPVFNPPVVAVQPAPQPAPVAAPAPQPPPAPAAPDRAQLIAQAGALFQSQQFEASLELLERIAREHPPVDDQLRTYLDAARNALYEMLKVQWPRPDLVPEIRMSAAQVMQLKLSPEAGFIFSRVDGMSTVDEILAMGGLDPFTTLRALSQLLRAGVIGVQS